MVDLSVLPAFVAVILLFLAPPGPDMAYVTAAGLHGGRRAAVLAVLGIGTGMSVHAVAVVLGLGRIATEHPTLLDVVKLVGAAYLAWLALVTFRDARRGSGARADRPPERPYGRGVLVSLANPKVLLFFVAVLPQFLGDATSSTAQLAMLGAVNVTTEVMLYGAVGVAAGSVHARLAGSRRAGTVLSVVAGVVYLGLALAVTAETVAGVVAA